MRLTRPLLVRQISVCFAFSLVLVFPMLSMAAQTTGAGGEPGSFISTPPDMTYFAVQGDTLSAIAKRYTDKTRNWTILGKRNKIDNDRTIPIGTAILIPLELLPEEDSEAKVIAMTGIPSYKTKDGSSGNLALGTVIKEGTQITTDKNGFLTLSLIDESRLSIPSNSQISLTKLRKTKYTGSPRTEVNLLLGKLESRVTSLVSNKGRFEVRTNLAVAGVRGTNFRVGVNEDGIANEVLSGGVAVANTTGTTGKKPDELLLTAGKGNIISSSGVGKAVDLLPAPVMSELYVLQERPTLQFQVETNPDATGYRVQIAKDAEILNVLAENRFKDNRFKFDGFADANYFVRITAIDKAGLEGFPLVKAVTLKARPEPPFTVQPKNKVRAERLDFAWTEASDAVAYHLQVAKDAEFKNLLIEKNEIKEVQFSSDRPADGNYYWRIATITQKEGKADHGPFSDVQKFAVLPVTSLAPPSEGNGNQLSFNWASEPGQKFLIQISTDAQFSKLFLSRELDQAELKIDRPQAGTYFIRVRSTDPDGYVGAFSATQKITIQQRWTSGDGSPINSGGAAVGTNF
ncbi:FecR domain-containing protein [Undibacterium sp. Ji50W]|uniref:FecR domain-containing protein n=1 Tax=Undibacterium sp. Ji50W TaxID=3413041 RepID=UPI003BF12F6E